MSSDDYEIIDCHFHLFRDINLEKALHTAYPSGPVKRERDYIATPERIVPYMARVGISKLAFVCVFPTKKVIEANVKRLSPTLTDKERDEAKEQIKKSIPERIRRYNQWACSIGRQYSQLLPFIGIQPALGREGMVEEIEARWREGAKGVKLHPPIVGFSPQARVLWPFYERCQELGIPILACSRISGGRSPSLEYGRPMNFAPVLRAFPRLKLILAHLPSAYWDERVELAKQFPNVCFDISPGFGPGRDEGRSLATADAVRVMRKIGVERILLGSDGPFQDSIDIVGEVLGLDLTEKEKQMILSENAKRLIEV